MSDKKMRYVRLGESGLKISPFIVGCMSYGSKKWGKSNWIKEADEALPLLKAAFDAGINTWDTANMYSNGESERIIGAALKKYAIPRAQVVIMTKARFPVCDDPEILGNDEVGQMPQYQNRWGLSRIALFEQVDASLERLGTDYIDVLQIHRLDDTPFVEVMKALHDLVQCGKVRYIGASSMWAHEFVQMQSIAEARGWTKFVSMQNEHNLLYREEEREMIRYCNKTGVGLVPWSPLAGGALTRPLSELQGQTERAETAKGSLKNHADSESDSEIIRRVEEVAKKRGWTMAQVGYVWSMSKVTSPILGISSEQRLKEFVDAVNYRLTDEERKYLEEPYKPKPVHGFNTERTTS